MHRYKLVYYVDVNFSTDKTEFYRVFFHLFIRVFHILFPYELICGGREYRWRSRKEEVFFYQYEGHVIWGLTAKLIRAFADVVRDRETGYEKHV